MGSKKTPKGKKTTAVKDLTAKDAKTVKGGHAADPDEGGEITKRLTR